jgi:hypothetical protein
MAVFATKSRSRINMPLVLQGAQCTKKLSVPESALGKQVRCPLCAAVFTASVGGPLTAEPPAATHVTARPPAGELIRRAPVVPPPLPQEDLAEADDEVTPRSRAAATDSVSKKPDNVPKKPHPALQALGIAAGCLGAVIGSVAGFSMLIVAVFAALVGVPLYYLTSGRRRRMVPAVAIQAGQALWMLLGAVLIAARVVQVNAVAINVLNFVDFGVYLGLAFLLVLLPNLPMIIFLTVYQAIYFVLNLLALTMPEVTPEFRKALVLHLFLRVLAVGAMYMGYFAKDNRPPLTLEDEVDDNGNGDYDNRSEESIRSRRR